MITTNNIMQKLYTYLPSQSSALNTHTHTHITLKNKNIHIQLSTLLCALTPTSDEQIKINKKFKKIMLEQIY